MDFHQVFNQKLLEFANDLCGSFPHISDFQNLRVGVLFIQNVDYKTLETIFRNHVVIKYKTQLLNKDENFFLQYEDYEKNTNYWQSLIKELKQIWKTLDETDKNNIWKYFKILIILSDKCNS